MEKDLLKYAELVILKGINLQKNQNLLIEGSIENYEFLRMLAKTAYEYGAKYVRLKITDTEILKTRLDFSEDENLKFIPEFEKTFFEELVKDKWAKIRIDNTEDIDLLSTLDNKKLSIYQKALSIGSKLVSNAAMNNEIAWCVICAPGPKWAAKVLNKPEGQKTLEEFFEIQKKIMRIDTENPIKSWEEHDKKLHERCHILNEMKLEKLIFKNKKTDLEVYLLPDSIWTGGAEKMKGTEIAFNANMPTEESFTTPNYKKTNGVVYSTRPVMVLGTLINEVWLEFKDGKVINFGCNNEEQKKILEEYLSMDEQAKYLGEVALVDLDSPIYQSGLVFSSILYDENASPHIALGAAYSSCLKNESDLKTDKDKLNYGCNVSTIHKDFMIGTDDIEIIGIGYNGDKYKIIENGKFVFKRSENSD